MRALATQQRVLAGRAAELRRPLERLTQQVLSTSAADFMRHMVSVKYRWPNEPESCTGRQPGLV